MRMSKRRRTSITIEPLFFSTTGGMAPECTRLNKRVAELIASKTGEGYSHVKKFLRTRLQFALLRCMVIAVRGTRGKTFAREEMDVGEISFNLIPEAPENDY